MAATVYTGGTSTVWTAWCDNASTSTAGDCWGNWVATSGTSTASTDVVWRRWSTTSTASGIYVPSRKSGVYEAPVRSQAQQLADREESNRRVEAYRVEAALQSRLRKEAEDRAELLLVQNLSLEQQLQFKRERSFVVTGRRGYRYRIRQGRSGNVDMVRPDGTIESRLCAHPNVNCPDPDTMLAQKIMLELDEDAFLKVANRHPVIDRLARVLPTLQ